MKTRLVLLLLLLVHLASSQDSINDDGVNYAKQLETPQIHRTSIGFMNEFPRGTVSTPGPPITQLSPEHSIIPNVVESPLREHVVSISPVINKGPPQSPNCECARSIKCSPCGIASFIDVARICPCLNCKKCPPVSLVHQIAGSKAAKDQSIIFNLQGISSKISKFLGLVSKYGKEVIEHEHLARDAAQNMEQASLKAGYARSEMFKVLL